MKPKQFFVFIHLVLFITYIFCVYFYIIPLSLLGFRNELHRSDFFNRCEFPYISNSLLYVLAILSFLLLLESPLLPKNETNLFRPIVSTLQRYNFYYIRYVCCVHSCSPFPFIALRSLTWNFPRITQKRLEIWRAKIGNLILKCTTHRDRPFRLHFYTVFFLLNFN